MEQLRLRIFQFFASAIQFNLMPEEQLLNEGGIWNKFKDVVRRLKLRYGMGRPYGKLESNQVEANKFALIWNEVILTFREEDIVRDKEVEMLELPQNTWNVRVIRWPCILLCNELLLALGQAKDLVDAPDKWLWHKICKHEYPRCAVVEAYDCVKHLLQLVEDGLAARPRSGTGLLFENAIELPAAENEIFYRQVRRLYTILTSKDSMHDIPRNLEARRKIAFFSNSLFMNLPHAPQVEKMLAFSLSSRQKGYIRK